MRGPQLVNTNWKAVSLLIIVKIRKTFRLYSFDEEEDEDGEESTNI